MKDTNTTRVVVIGGGYAGVLAANRLQSADVDVTLINPRPQFVERIRLHQLVAGNHTATQCYDELLAGGVRLVVDSAQRIDAAARVVHVRTGAPVAYDYLIYAVGSRGTAPEFAYGITELEQAQRLAEKLAGTAADAPIVVVGGGLTGIETAAELAEQGRDVTLVGTRLAPSLAASGRRSVARRLHRLGVAVIEDTTVSAVTADAVRLADGRVLPSAVTVWTAGFGVPGLAAASGLSTDELGRLRTDETLTSIDDAHIVAAGDAAAPSDLPLRMSCQAAMPLGAQAAHTVLARIAGQQPEPISQAFVSQCISVGRRGGTVQFAHADDRPRSAYLGGRTAAFIKEQICSMTVTALRKEARRPGFYRWLKSDWHTALVAELQDAAR